MLFTSFDPFGEFDRITQRAFGQSTWATRAALPMDGTRRENDVVLHFDLPGIRREDIEVSVDHGVLSVTATRDEDKTDGDRPFIRERVHGKLSRRIYLGDAYDTGKVEATFDNGVLTVRVPLAEKVKARKVEISSNTDKMIAA